MLSLSRYDGFSNVKLEQLLHIEILNSVDITRVYPTITQTLLKPRDMIQAHPNVGFQIQISLAKQLNS